MIIALIGIIIFIILIIVLLYNSLVAKKNAVGNAFGSIDAMLKKRYDLLPNLVETVKQYMNYEQDTLTKVTEIYSTAEFYARNNLSNLSPLSRREREKDVQVILCTFLSRTD